MVQESCDPRTSCGISTGFPMLSPSERQVAHALLTRPPLTNRKSKLPLPSVRLACVRHAASVRPEPGSNSLTKFKQFRRTVNVIRLSDPEDFWFVFRNFYEFTSQLLFRCFQVRRLVILESTGYKIHCLIFKVHPQPFSASFLLRFFGA